MNTTFHQINMILCSVVINNDTPCWKHVALLLIQAELIQMYTLNSETRTPICLIKRYSCGLIRPHYVTLGYISISVFRYQSSKDCITASIVYYRLHCPPHLYSVFSSACSVYTTPFFFNWSKFNNTSAPTTHTNFFPLPREDELEADMGFHSDSGGWIICV